MNILSLIYEFFQPKPIVYEDDQSYTVQNGIGSYTLHAKGGDLKHNVVYTVLKENKQ